ncbi:MAG: hypothetical protein IJ617_01470 [Oscillospiraceae bacterium]|nr:hypothetical protein [Oscillospiraceae bacterium]
MIEKRAWRYCVVGNIVRAHYDSDGILRHGTSAYVGGAKVYLAGKSWDNHQNEISILGLTRGKRQQVHEVPVELIENVRCQRVYQPSILNIMGVHEFACCWWGNTQEDKKSAEEFAVQWNCEKEE